LDFQELVKYRRSSRWLFSKKPILDVDLRKILEAARYAPTPHNSQPYEIIIVNDREVIKQISEIGFKLNEKAVDAHFQWTRQTREELAVKKDGVYINALPKFVLDLKDNPQLINDEKFWKKAMELYAYLIQSSSCLVFILYSKKSPGIGSLAGLWGILSIGGVMQNIWLAANDLGISVQLVSGQLMVPESAHKLQEILGIPKHGYRLMLILRLGYEGKFGKYGTKTRRELHDFVHLNHFGNKM
jgi:nitroreductase